MVRWSPGAAEDLTRIAEHIRRENPSSAQRIARTIYERANILEAFPRLGKIGRVEGTRELPLPSLPFLIVYRVAREEVVEIVNIIHGAQQWP